MNIRGGRCAAPVFPVLQEACIFVFVRQEFHVYIYPYIRICHESQRKASQIVGFGAIALAGRTRPLACQLVTQGLGVWILKIFLIFLIVLIFLIEKHRFRLVKPSKSMFFIDFVISKPQVLLSKTKQNQCFRMSENIDFLGFTIQNLWF